MKHITAILAFGLSTLLGATAAWAEDITFTYSNWLPATHHFHLNGMLPWFQKIEEATEGRVKVRTLPKVVGTPASQFEVARDGLADITFVIPGYTPGRFPLTEMGDFALGGKNAMINAPTFNDIYEERLAKYGEFDDVKLMAIFNSNPGGILTSEKELKTIDDMKGLKLRSTGSYASELMNNIGAVPIQKPSTEAYELLSTGAIDGGFAQPDTVTQINMLDMTKYFTVIPGGFFNATLAIVMNKESWARISPEDQKAIEAVSHTELAKMFGKSFADAEKAALRTMEDRDGTTVNTADDAFVAAVREASAPIEKVWADNAKAKGVEDALEILEEYRSRLAAARIAGN